MTRQRFVTGAPALAMGAVIGAAGAAWTAEPHLARPFAAQAARTTRVIG